MLTVTVVIPAYNEAHSIVETIRSVQAQTRPADRIIVVDDCSTDNTGDVARGTGAEVIRPTVNQGTKAQAQNVALPCIDTDLTVTIDADTTLKEDALEKIVVPFEQDPKLAVASGYLIPRFLDTAWERGRLIEYLYGLELYKTAQSQVGAPVVCSGAFSVFRTVTLKAHGGFDPGTMAEDMNYTWKVHTSGGRATFVPEAICYPVEPSTWQLYFKQMDRWMRAFFQNLMIFWKRLHRKPMLAVFIWTGVLEVMILPLALFATLYVAYRAANGDFQLHWGWWFASVFGLDLFMVTIFSWRGAKRTDRTHLVWRSLPYYYMVKFLNIWMWWRGFYLEVVVRQRLQTWQKGH